MRAPGFARQDRLLGLPPHGGPATRLGEDEPGAGEVWPVEHEIDGRAPAAAEHHLGLVDQPGALIEQISTRAWRPGG
jgi:hypothetical protein